MSQWKKFFVLALIIISLAACGESSTVTSTVTPTSQPTQSPTPIAKPTQPPKWTTTHTFTGNGIQKTSVFTVSDDFKLTWKCNPSSDYFGQYNVMVDLDSPDGSYVDSAVNTICKAGNTSGSTELHGDAGQVYLDINSEDVWTIQIQELK